MKLFEHTVITKEHASNLWSMKGRPFFCVENSLSLEKEFEGAGVFWLFIHRERVSIKLLYCFIWKYWNLETSSFLRWPLICCSFCLFVFWWTRHHTDLEQMLKKSHQDVGQNGDESWKLIQRSTIIRNNNKNNGFKKKSSGTSSMWIFHVHIISN